MKQYKKIIFFSSSRADLGILKKIVEGIKIKNLSVFFIICGEYKSYETRKVIIEKKKNFKIKFINLKKQSKDKDILTKNFNYVFSSISNLFDIISPDLLLLLGDRYETLSAACSAKLKGIPIAHFHGGEITENSYDNLFRHSITKLSHLHFTSHNVYKKRVIQMGEVPQNVFNVGAPGLLNINENLYSKSNIEEKLNVIIKKNFFIITLHPETIKLVEFKKNLEIFFDGIQTSVDPETTFLFTEPGKDMFASKIEKRIISFCRKNKNVYYKKNLGNKLYHSCLNIAKGVIGNSSSGLIEAPNFNTITLNIGDRQKGRLIQESVINLNYNKKRISNKINSLKKNSFIKKNFKNIFYNKNCINILNKVLKKFLNNLHNSKIKKFYDIEFDIK